jgi:hypothetical protein
MTVNIDLPEEFSRCTRNAEPQSGTAVQFGNLIFGAKEFSRKPNLHRQLIDIIDLNCKIEAIFDRKDWFST